MALYLVKRRDNFTFPSYLTWYTWSAI